MEYMIRFTQTHETFRLAEIKALAALENIELEVLSYSPSVYIPILLPSLSLYTNFNFLKTKIVTILFRQTPIRRSSRKINLPLHPRQSNLRILGERILLPRPPR